MKGGAIRAEDIIAVSMACFISYFHFDRVAIWRF